MTGRLGSVGRLKWMSLKLPKAEYQDFDAVLHAFACRSTFFAETVGVLRGFFSDWLRGGWRAFPLWKVCLVHSLCFDARPAAIHPALNWTGSGWSNRASCGTQSSALQDSVRWPRWLWAFIGPDSEGEPQLPRFSTIPLYSDSRFIFLKIPEADSQESSLW